MFNAHGVNAADGAPSPASGSSQRHNIAASHRTQITPPNHLRPAVQTHAAQPYRSPSSIQPPFSNTPGRRPGTIASFIEGKINAFQAVARTTSEIQACGNDWKAADGCIRKLTNSFNRRTGERAVPDAKLYHEVIEVHFRGTHPSGIKYWFHEMLKQGITPLAGSYHRMICACLAERRPSAIQDANAWFDHMLQRDVVPTAATYDFVVSRNAKLGDARRADDGLARMVAHGAQPNDRLYGVVIWALVKNGDPEGGVRWFEHLRDVGQAWGARPNSSHCDAVMRAAAMLEDPQLAARWFAEMQRLGIVPTEDTFAEWMSAHLGVGDLDGARAVFEELVETGPTYATDVRPEGLRPNRRLCMDLIVAYEEADRPDEASALLDRFRAPPGAQGPSQKEAPFRHLVGLDESRNLMNLRMHAAVTMTPPQHPEAPVEPAFARVAIRLLRNEGRIDRATRFDVGQRDDGRVMAVVEEFMQRQGWTADSHGVRPASR
jgi:pentatricopeptide repeat protein